MLKKYSTELEQAVYQVVYYSTAQRLRRAFALFLLIIKHSLRSVMLMWPVYLLISVVIVMPLNNEYFFYILALLPGLLLWCTLYYSAILREYRTFVAGRVLVNSDFKKIFQFK